MGEKIEQHTTLKKFIDDDLRHVSCKEMIEEMILPNTPQQWHMGLARLGTKSNSPAKDVVSAFENFDDY